MGKGVTYSTGHSTKHATERWFACYKGGYNLYWPVIVRQQDQQKLSPVEAACTSWTQVTWAVWWYSKAMVVWLHTSMCSKQGTNVCFIIKCLAELCVALWSLTCASLHTSISPCPLRTQYVLSCLTSSPNERILPCSSHLTLLQQLSAFGAVASMLLSHIPSLSMVFPMGTLLNVLEGLVPP